MKYLGFIFLSFFISLSTFGRAQIIDTVGNTTIRIDSLIGFTGVAEDWPWDVQWGPDNSLWFTVGDKVCRYDTTTHLVHTVLNRPDTTSNTMSIAFHPNFGVTPIVYVTVDTAEYYYSYSGGPIVLYKYNYSASGDSLYNETSILGWSHGGEHCGGRLHVGQDGYLYCTTAEYFFSSETIGDLHGRVLRINLDGTVPGINISGDYPITKGHRNPQGIVQVPNGNVIVSEFGAIIDELNLIQEYKNYGWPAYDGFNCFNVDSCASPTYIHEAPIDTAMRPPSGIDWYDHPAIPEFQGCILQCILSFGGNQGGLVASKLNAAMDDVVSDVHYFKGEYLRWRDVCVAPDGKVFAITNDRQIPVIRCISNPNYHIGIEEFQNVKINLYPNPTVNFVTLKSEINIGEWEIHSMESKLVANGKANSSSTQIDVSLLSPGIYFIKLSYGTRKFIKE